MVVETKVLIVARLAEIGHELNQLKDLPPVKRARRAKALRVERRKLTQELKATSGSAESL